jgi:uncharacterized protein (DUF58 family)
VSEALFDAGFRDLLHWLIRRVRRLHGRRDEAQRARRSRLGQSGTFAGHRPYTAGEDIRQLDWNAYARTGDFFLKVLEEEERRTWTILLDTSPSMTAGDPPRFDGARRLAALFGGLVLARLDGLYLVAGGDVLSLSGGGEIERLLGFLAALEPVGGGAEALVRTPIDRRFLGRVCWLSDFADLEDVQAGLRLLRPRRRDSIGVLPEIPDDRLPPVGGWVELRDPETGARERVRVDAALRGAMEKELVLLARRRDAAFARVGVPLVRQPIPTPGDMRPESWLPGEWIHWR